MTARLSRVVMRACRELKSRLRNLTSAGIGPDESSYRLESLRPATSTLPYDFGLALPTTKAGSASNQNVRPLGVDHDQCEEGVQQFFGERYSEGKGILW